MELKQLNQFAVLSEELSFRKAAARLHMSQPPLSISIKTLEDELGVRLFERRSTGVVITEEGNQILANAHRALHYAQQVKETARMSAQGRAGTLRVSFVASATFKLLSRTITNFREQQPDADLRLTESTADQITSALHECRIDVGLVRYPAEVDDSLSMEIVERNTLVAVLPLKHALAKRSSLRLQELRNEPFIFFERVKASTTHTTALTACLHAGFVPNIVQQVSFAQTMLSLVESGMGVALVPDTYESLAQRRLSFKPLADLVCPPIGIALLYRKEEGDRPFVCSFREAALAVDAQSEICLRT